MNLYQLVACQGGFWTADTREQLNKNIDHALELIRCGAGIYHPAKLFAFGELNISGLAGFTIEERRKLAITIPGEETERFVKLAKELNTYIVPGSWLEFDPEYDKALFNTSFLAGPQGILAKYRKINTLPKGDLNTSPHDLLNVGYDTKKTPLFPVAKTEIGNCYDAYFPEVTRQLAYNGAEILVGVCGIFYPGGDRILDWWNSCTKVRSMENVCYGLYVNGGSTPSQAGISMSGRSQIVDYQGRVLTILDGPGEAMTAATIDIDMLRHHRKSLINFSLLFQVRTEAYDYWKTPKMKMHPELATQETRSSEEENVIRTRDRDEFYSEYYGE
jgi:predicted amidohydrolase